MFKKLFSFLTIAVFAFVFSAGFSPASAQTAPVPADIYSSVSVRVDNVDYKTLYSFVTDIRNDQLWYPGIINTTVLQSGPHGRLVGTVYQQQASVIPGLVTNTRIEVMSTLKNKMHLIKGDGDVADYTALYTFKKASNGGGIFTLTSKYTVAGMDEATFRQYITYALGGLLRYYNSPGEVTVHFVYLD